MLQLWYIGLFILIGFGNIHAQTSSTVNYQKAHNWHSQPTVIYGPLGTSWLISDTNALDIFYIHPTTFVTGFKKNGNMHKPGVKRKVNIMAMNQLSAFFDLGNVYIPAYRQARLKYVLGGKLHQRTKALNLAYQDVSAAFGHFLEQHDSSTPIIIVAHGQGSLHAQRLLISLTDSNILNRLVAAYLVGYPYCEISSVGANMNRPYCQDSMQTGCIISWQTYGRNANFKSENIPLFWDRNQYVTEVQSPFLCTNPLTWRSNQDTLINRKVDALRPTNSLKMPSRTLGYVATTTVKDAHLIIYGEPRLLFNSTGDNHHKYDYNLFYSEIRQNAQQRIIQWKQTHSR